MADGAHGLSETKEERESRPSDGGAAEGSGGEEAAVYFAPVRTRCAGLFFLVPVMSRLGVAAFLEANPTLIELDFPRLLLRHVFERLRFPADDPVARALVTDERADTRDAFNGLTLLLEDWTRAMRRWCRRRARVGLSELVRREGRLLATGTHLELFFDHRSADIRVRRAGLDLDPGWVAWLGRVVQFHYHNLEQADGDL
jgi:hypothetical protein